MQKQQQAVTLIRTCNVYPRPEISASCLRPQQPSILREFSFLAARHQALGVNNSSTSPQINIEGELPKIRIELYLIMVNGK